MLLANTPIKFSIMREYIFNNQMSVGRPIIIVIATYLISKNIIL